jgi:hypothetical protein
MSGALRMFFHLMFSNTQFTAYLGYVKLLFRSFSREVPRHNIFYLLKLPFLPPCRVAVLFPCEASITSLLVVLHRQLSLAFAAMGGFFGREFEGEFHVRVKSLFFTWQ